MIAETEKYSMIKIVVFFYTKNKMWQCRPATFSIKQNIQYHSFHIWNISIKCWFWSRRYHQLIRRNIQKALWWTEDCMMDRYYSAHPLIIHKIAFALYYACHEYLSRLVNLQNSWNLHLVDRGLSVGQEMFS